MKTVGVRAPVRSVVKAMEELGFSIHWPLTWPAWVEVYRKKAPAKRQRRGKS